ncbi:OmpA family protein [Mycobacterium sp.]|uniref:channel-forming protein ArfA/OmpATb n=1 Tax=Mycobacterium sp. TaxID=1785 RepID=UPI003C728FAB
MGGSDEVAEATEWRRTSKYYVRLPGLPWLVGLLVIPLLLAVIGHGELDRTRPGVNGPTGAFPTLHAPKPAGGVPPTPTIPAIALAPVSITRSGNDIKLSGDMPTGGAKASLLAALKEGFGPNIDIVDNVRINRDITSLDFSNAAPVFKAAASVPDFGLAVKDDTITLIGTTGSGGQQDVIEQAAVAAWPNLNIVDTMGIGGSVTASAPPGPVPALGPGNGCSNLRSAVKSLGPISFASDGTSLSAAAEQTLNQVADKLKDCPGVSVTINGYTDNAGNDAINIPLSTTRADAVADYLVSRGVARDHLTARGRGAADPVADNNSPDGKAKNRRVEIVVG